MSCICLALSDNKNESHLQSGRAGVSAKVSRGGVRSVVHGKWHAGAWLGAASLAAGAAQSHALAEEASRGDAEASGDVIEVVGKRLDEGLGTRYTAPLLETPQTITLVPREIMDQQNLLTMREVLS